MSGSLTNRYTLVAKIEDTPGTFDTAVYSATYGKHQLIGVPTFEFDFPTIQRGVVRPTLTPVPGLTGARNATISGLNIELIGHASSSVPTWDAFVRACGMRRETLEKITIGAITGGPFRHGETITQTSSGATAKVFMDTYTGTTTLYVYDIVGTENNSNVWTGGTSAATATPSTAGSAAGYGYAPVDFDTVTVTYSGSDPSVGEVVTGATSGAIGVIESISTSGSGGTAKIRVRNAKIYTNTEALTASTTGSIGNASAVAQEDMPTLSIAGYEDGVRKSATGCRGTFTLAGNVGEPVRFQFTFNGAYADVSDVAQLTGITYENRATPPLMLGSNTTLRSEGVAGSYATRFSAISLALGNVVSQRPDASAASGIREYMITGRAGTGSLDPEADLESSFPVLGNFRDGDVGALQFTVGSTVGNQFIMQVPGLRFTATPVGDRNGIRTYNTSFELTGGAMANVSNSPNERNDMLLAYITS